ncbi:hypothetical protein COOONC_17934 [Cooperia oncophora]
MFVKRFESVTPVRRFYNLDLTGENFKKFIKHTGTKLHASSMCANREIAAIGTHEIKSFKPPLKYLALPWDELHVSYMSFQSSSFVEDDRH